MPDHESHANHARIQKLLSGTPRHHPQVIHLLRVQRRVPPVEPQPAHARDLEVVQDVLDLDVAEPLHVHHVKGVSVTIVISRHAVRRIGEGSSEGSLHRPGLGRGHDDGPPLHHGLLRRGGREIGIGILGNLCPGLRGIQPHGVQERLQYGDPVERHGPAHVEVVVHVEVVPVVVVAVELVHDHRERLPSLVRQLGNHGGVAPRRQGRALRAHRQDLVQRQLRHGRHLLLGHRLVLLVRSLEQPPDLILREERFHVLLRRRRHGFDVVPVTGEQLAAEFLGDFGEVVQSLAIVARLDVEAVFAESISVGEVDHDVS
mmetsp:Transcript_22021/g.47247  ORF Transcript_22021/g.47247 Transcript_22021/m.47247 type:complete len:316 (-) Transcript_22021:1887-2834(-)